MTDLQEPYSEILEACRTGDLVTLETLISRLDIGPNHPNTPYGLDQNLPLSQQPPCVEFMLCSAIKGQQIETLNFLHSKFPSCSFASGPIYAALNTGNAEVLAAICKLDPVSANSETGFEDMYNVLPMACQMPNAAALIKVLLDAGADPNKPPPYPFPYSFTIPAALQGGLPISTFEQFFDAGYEGNGLHDAEAAVKCKRPDVLEILFQRAPVATAWFPPEKELIKLARKNGDGEMVRVIKRDYPLRFKKVPRRRLIAKFSASICLPIGHTTPKRSDRSE